MTSCKKYCRNSSLLGPAMLGLLATLLFCASAAAQGSLDQRYQRAVQLYENAKSEDACELFQQIQKENPGYPGIQTYLKPACDDANHAYVMEDGSFKAGVQFFNQKRFDEAKGKFEETSRFESNLKRPRYGPQVQDYLKKIETLLRDEDSYQGAVQLFNQGKDDDAAKRFSQIAEGGGTRADDARKYLQQINERREDSAWNEAVNLFKSRDFTNARRKFGQVIQINGTHSSEAKDYLSKIDVAEADQQAFDAAVHVFDEKRYADASALFKQLIKNGSGHSNDAQTYLQRIDDALRREQAVTAASEQAKKKAAETGQDPKQVALQLLADARTAVANRQYPDALGKLQVAESLDPANREVRSLLSQAQELAVEEPLREGLKAYFQGQYNQAEERLSAYVESHGPRLALAYFFRGAVHGSLYFLSSERDTQEKELALADFRALQKITKQFPPPKKYVSPKILSLYSQAVGARQQ